MTPRGHATIFSTSPTTQSCEGASRPTLWRHRRTGLRQMLGSTSQMEDVAVVTSVRTVIRRRPLRQVFAQTRPGGHDSQASDPSTRPCFQFRKNGACSTAATYKRGADAAALERDAKPEAKPKAEPKADAKVDTKKIPQGQAKAAPATPAVAMCRAWNPLTPAVRRRLWRVGLFFSGR